MIFVSFSIPLKHIIYCFVLEISTDNEIVPTLFLTVHDRHCYCSFLSLHLVKIRQISQICLNNLVTIDKLLELGIELGSRILIIFRVIKPA